MGTVCNGMAYGGHDGSAYDDPDLKREKQGNTKEKIISIIPSDAKQNT